MKKTIILFMVMVLMVNVFVATGFGVTAKNEVDGKLYTFDEKSDYEFSNMEKYIKTDKLNTYGIFSVDGNITAMSTMNNLPSYEVSSGNLNFHYLCNDSMYDKDEKEWHSVEDKTKKIDGNKMFDKIMNGAVLIQTSKDCKNWVNVGYQTNIFADASFLKDSFYTTTNMQTLNGCYYRVVFVYKLGKLAEEKKVLFVNTKKYDYKKCAEVYEFYVYSASENNADNVQTYNLGEKVRTKNFDGYSGTAEITKKDAHYGWELGNFFVSGYSGKLTYENGNTVFLKNPGDKVALYFRLKQNIKALNGNEDLFISEDKEGYDEYFETPRMNFGKGTLIIRHTDYKNVKGKPEIYVNYLEGNAVVDADTKVQLFEEGDYEVALDYQITNNKLIDKLAHYRISFKFSVRNGNCMVYPFDIDTGSELGTSSYVEKGFKLDFAKSRYLKMNVKREILVESEDGPVLDTRASGPAKDGESYTTPGIYTITANNEYTNQIVSKRIYVGQNKYIKAMANNDMTSIDEINEIIKTGATILDNGTIVREEKTDDVTAQSEEKFDIETDEKNEYETEATQEKGNGIIWIILVAVLLVAIAILIITKKYKIFTNKQFPLLKKSDNGEENNG